MMRVFPIPGLISSRIVDPFDEVRGTTRLPVAAIQMPPTPGERDFYEELLVAMGVVLPSGLRDCKQISVTSEVW